MRCDSEDITKVGEIWGDAMQKVTQLRSAHVSVDAGTRPSTDTYDIEIGDGSEIRWCCSLDILRSCFETVAEDRIANDARRRCIRLQLVGAKIHRTESVPYLEIYVSRLSFKVRHDYAIRGSIVDCG